MQTTRLLACRHILVKELLLILCLGLTDLVQDISNLLAQGAVSLGFGTIAILSHLIAHFLVDIQILLAVLGGLILMHRN